MPQVDWVALTVFIILFLAITVMGFLAVHWRRGDLNALDEWGLGGRRFGAWITWFLIGGDVYTAYTFIAVPALAFGAGAVAFYAVPYTVLIYPILFMVFPRLWSVAHKHGYITASDFIMGRYNNRWLALAVTVTGIVATMPYIALQLRGLQVVIGAMGIGGTGLMGDLPLLISFIILAAFTYTSGLRAPASIAIVKDILIYIAVLAAVIVAPIALGGYAKIFAAIPPAKLLLATPPAGSGGAFSAYATLALGSAMALWLYPHAITGILSASSAKAIKKNAVALPAYSLMLGLLALIGFMGIAAGLDKAPEFAAGFKAYGPQFAVPALYMKMFPSWFVGVCFAAIGIGALVPAAIMSIAAANLWSRNIYKDFINRSATGAQEAQQAKLASLVVKIGALVFIVFLQLQYALQLQLLGGVWIIQTLPAVLVPLYTRWFNSWALLVGWAVGMIGGTAVAASTGFANANYTLVIAGFTMPGYSALYTVILNIVIAAILTPVFNGIGARDGRDSTAEADYQS